MTRLTRLALDHPSITVLIMVFLVVAGIGAARALNQELVPDIEFPFATVVTVWPGASADEMTTGVTRPIEDELDTIDEIDLVQVSSTTSESFSAVTVRGEYGTKQDELRDTIDRHLATVQLPNGAEDPDIVLISFDAFPVVAMSVSGDLDRAELQQRIKTDVVPELEGIDGVGKVTVSGDQEDKIFVTLDQSKMTANGVTVSTIQNVLSANNLSFPAGTLLVPGESIPLQVSNRLRSEDDLRRLVLVPEGAGGPGASAGGPPEGASGAGTGGTTVSAPAGAAGQTEPTAEASPTEAPATAVAATGPFPLPQQLQDLGYQTTDDLTPDLVRRLEATDPEMLREVAAEIIAALPVGSLDALPKDVVDALPSDVRSQLEAHVAGQAAAETPLPVVWAALGARTAADITPDMMAVALEQAPDAVSELTGAHLLALPAASLGLVPAALIERQTADVRAQLDARRAAAPTATPEVASSATGGGEEPGGITLGDVATVERAPEDAATISRTNGQPSLGISVLKEQNGNTVNVVNDVLDKVDEIKDTAGFEKVEFNTVFEQGSFIEESLSGVRREGLLGALFAVLVILVFLSFSLRATLVTAISIPLSVVTALLLMRSQNLTLNMLTLSGLTIAIGRIVDDAIVVTENIFRHLQRGDRRALAVFDGTREVATAITASTLVTVAVFLPLGLIGGITRQFFLPFGLTASYALLASLLVALTVVPLLARWLLGRSNVPEDRESWLQRLYTPPLEWALDHRALTLVLAMVFFLLSLVPLRFIPKTFMPDFGEATLSVAMAMPPGTDLVTTDQYAQKVEALLQADEDIETVQATVGGGGSRSAFMSAGGGDTAAASFTAAFVKRDEGFFDRFKDSADKLDPKAVADRIRRQLPEIAGDEAITFTVSAASMTGMGGNTYDLQILSDDEAKLGEANALIMAALEDTANWKEDSNALQDLFKSKDEKDAETKVPIINLQSNLTAARPVLSIDVDPSKALARGLTTVQVGLAMKQVLEGQSLGEVTLGSDGKGETIEVIARYPADTIKSVPALADFKLAAPSGEVRLGDIATVTQRPGPVQITRVDGKRAALISGEITEDDTFGVTAKAQQIIDDLELDEELGEDVVEVGAGVESSQQQEGFSDMLAAVAISILVVYLIMVFTFRSLVHPFTILFSLPFAASGAFLALAVTGRALSITSLIGVLMLVGIVVTNAIVLVDLVQQYRKAGMDARTALVRGGRTRLRPILMTAIATVLALTPQALELTGEGGLIASDLAVTVIGGLLTSTFLTLIVVPVVYSLLDRLSRRGDGGDEAGVPVPGAPDGGPVVPDTAAMTVTPDWTPPAAPAGWTPGPAPDTAPSPTA
jgi:hydrophobic/amphiphilic exporter-1 (mainly G- bacteria), HAE1 family